MSLTYITLQRIINIDGTVFISSSVVMIIMFSFRKKGNRKKNPAIFKEGKFIVFSIA